MGRILKPEEAKLWHLIGRTTKPVEGLRHHKLEELRKLIEETKEKNIEAEKIEDEKASHKMAIIKPPKAQIHIKHKIVQKVFVPVADISNEKRVRRGQLEIDAKIDLHGLTQIAAEEKVIHFIMESYAYNYRNLLIITGKGNPLRQHHEEFNLFESPRGILRIRLREWLNRPDIRKYISGISEANQKHGGYGAFYVKLKAKK